MSSKFPYDLLKGYCEIGARYAVGLAPRSPSRIFLCIKGTHSGGETLLDLERLFGIAGVNPRVEDHQDKFS
jgi:hypothetical protein